MRLAVEHFKRGFKVHHGRLRTRLISIRSLLHHLSYQVYDRGITLTPSYVRKDEVLRYLIDTYGAEKLDVIKSYSFGTYEVANYLMLDFGSKVTDDEDLRKDLDLLSSYYRTRKTEENISLYLNKKRASKGNVTVKPFAKFEYGRVKFKGTTDLSYHENYYTVGNTKEVYVSHIFYDALADYAQMPKNNEWTFRKELTREEEGKYILLVLDGSIKPNTTVGKKVHKAYMKEMMDKTPNIIFEETFMRRMEEIDVITKEIIESGKQLKGVTDYSVIYEDNGDEITHVPIYASYYAWDYDLNEPLDDVNRLRGVGGEFTREIKPDHLPYEVIIDGKVVEMFLVEIEEEPIRGSNYLETLEREYLDSIGDKFDYKKVMERPDYWINSDSLEPIGIPYLGEDDYVRALNATDLELNGEATMYMANMYFKLNLKAQQRAIVEYHKVIGSENKLELNMKTVLDVENELFIKQHIKYYTETDKNEQVVEGLLMLSEDLKEPNLFTIYSGETIVPLDLEDLEKKKLGVYVKESESMYAYKFLMMFDTQTGSIQRIADTIVGVNRKGNTLQPVSLKTIGLDEEQEVSLKEVIRKEVLNKVTDSETSQEYYKKVVGDYANV